MKNHHKVSSDLIKKLIEYDFPFSWNPEDLTIAELLDELREDRRRVAHRQYSELKDDTSIYPIYPKDDTSFPDYLAEFYLFDKENKYLP
jgi:hypothetical protein